MRRIQLISMSDGGNMKDFWVKDSIKDKLFEDYYDVGKELGRGATSTVLKCNQKRTNCHWAVKIIEKKVDKKIIATETGVLLQLNHPNIIRLKEIYETDCRIYMVLELVTGGELFDRIITRGYYSEKDAANCIREMTEAVKHIHQKDIVHRDLKPENLLYENTSDDSKLKIADFGLSKICSGEVQMQTVCGTPGYCAPEVLNGESYTPAVDLWSIGVIAYILLCGYEPFYGETEREMYTRIMKCDYEFDSPWWDPVSENAKDLVSKLLIKDANKRLTAAQVLQHPWVKGKAAKSEHMEQAQSKLKVFNAKRKLRVVTDLLMAFSPFGRSQMHQQEGQGECSQEEQQQAPEEQQQAAE